jgi:hypothetical protein
MFGAVAGVASGCCRASDCERRQLDSPLPARWPPESPLTSLQATHGSAVTFKVVKAGPNKVGASPDHEAKSLLRVAVTGSTKRVVAAWLHVHKWL